MEIAFKRKPKNLIKMLNIISIEKKFIKTVFLKLILFNRYTLKKHPSTQVVMIIYLVNSFII